MRFVNLTLRVPLEVAQAIAARAEVMGKSKAQVVVERLTRITEPPFSHSLTPPAAWQPDSSLPEGTSLQAQTQDSKLKTTQEQWLRVRQSVAQTHSDSCQLVAQSKQLVAQARILVSQSKQGFNHLTTRSDRAELNRAELNQADLTVISQHRNPSDRQSG